MLKSTWLKSQRYIEVKDIIYETREVFLAMRFQQGCSNFGPTRDNSKSLRVIIEVGRDPIRSLVQIPAQSSVGYEIRPSYSKHYPVGP